MGAGLGPPLDGPGGVPGGPAEGRGTEPTKLGPAGPGHHRTSFKVQALARGTRATPERPSFPTLRDDS